MSYAAAISAFVAARSRLPVCDACVADHLGMRAGQVAAAAIRMVRQQALIRFEGRCAGCCTTRTVIAGRSSSPQAECVLALVAP